MFLSVGHFPDQMRAHLLMSRTHFKIPSYYIIAFHFVGLCVAYASVFMWGCMHTQVEANGITVFFSGSPLYFLRQGLLVPLELTHWLDWLVSQAPKIHLFLLPGTKNADVYSHTWLCV